MDEKLVIRLNDASGQDVEIPLAGTDGYVLGRSDSRSSYIPDIDLAHFKALEKGVSRRHAAFVRYQQKLHILDLSSVNGTFLNGKRLKPDVPHMINSGDQLGLGDLVLTLSLEH
ncbi:MAG: FHA domain-containing protein [Anaerolineae bacterium]|nr:FHA domain-containing protein [Anaerolineae bacterium]MBN8617912.1 FHA domain-containing protein [Anaerolineae bacterium]